MNNKLRIAQEAVKQVENNMVVGLGTGSTVNVFIEVLAEKILAQNLTLTIVSSSTISEIYARDRGLSMRNLSDFDSIDLYVDGADQITADLDVLKGRGQDLVKEKLLARIANKFLVIATQDKLTSRIGGKFPIPIEVRTFAWKQVQQQVFRMGATHCSLRIREDNVFVTADGNYVLEAVFTTQMTVPELNKILNDIPCIVEHGIFTHLVDEVILVSENGIKTMAGTVR